MTIKELVERLAHYDQNLRVVVSGYEGGYKDVTMPQSIPLRLNRYTAWNYGPHDRVGGLEEDQTKDENAVWIV